METTAIYDSKTKEFIVNTPHPLAQKYWITNGAVHAKHVVVMAKLIGTDPSKTLNIAIIKYSLLDMDTGQCMGGAEEDQWSSLKRMAFFMSRTPKVSIFKNIDKHEL